MSSLEDDFNAASLPGIDDVQQARERIRAYVHHTSVITSGQLDTISGARLFFKCENFQKVGAFKVRGACNAVFSLNKRTATNGVTTHSSGNHGLALSYAAKCRGINCTVVMPSTAPDVKKAAVTQYNGSIVECAPSTAAREAAADLVISHTGAELVHPYNDLRVIAGQATCAVELLEDVNDLDAIVAPIGGGGLISGTCIARNALAPNTAVYAAEPEQADDAYRSFKSGKLVTEDAPNTIADGLKMPLRDKTWYFVSNYVNDIFIVSEQDIMNAMMLIWQRLKVVVEASCAVPLAVILKNPEKFKGQRVGVILTGGNVDLHKLPWLTKT